MLTINNKDRRMKSKKQRTFRSDGHSKDVTRHSSVISPKLNGEDHAMLHPEKAHLRLRLLQREESED